MQFAKLKRTWNLVQLLQIVQKIPENYCPCLELLPYQLTKLGYLMSCGSKDIFKNAPGSKDIFKNAPCLMY